MANEVSSNFNDMYAAISAKLKKRFLRKPNVTEITDEFNALGQECENAELPGFAGHSYMGAAKCEGSIGNASGEAEYHLKAARQFLQAYMNLCSRKCESTGREDLEAAIGCYMQAFAKYPEGSMLRITIMWELASNLRKIGHNPEAIHYYGVAVDMMGDKEDRFRFRCMMQIMELSIKCEKYEDALIVANYLADSKLKMTPYDLDEIAEYRILLGLLVDPSDDTHTPSLVHLYESLGSEKKCARYGATELWLYLHSLVLCCRQRDVEKLREAAAVAHLWMSITPQRDLLVKIVKHVENQ